MFHTVISDYLTYPPYTGMRYNEKKSGYILSNRDTLLKTGSLCW